MTITSNRRHVEAETIRIEIEYLSEIESPNLPSGVKSYIGYLPVNQFIYNTNLVDWDLVNPRNQNIYSSVAKEIKKTLLNEPDLFEMVNRGLYIACHQLSQDHPNTPRSYSMELYDKEMNGVLDGSTTLKKVIQSTSDPEFNRNNAYIRAEFLVGNTDKELLLRISRGRNTSVNVKPYSHINREGKFDALKAILNDAEIDPSHINWKENDEGIYGITQVLSHLYGWVPTRDGVSHPLWVYARTGTSLEKFGNANTYQIALLRKLPDLLRLRESIEASIDAKRFSDNSEYSSLKGIKEKKGDEKLLPIIGKEIAYGMPNAYISPIIAAFRSFLVWDESRTHCEWYKDPFDAVDSGLAAQMFDYAIFEALQEPNVSADIIGKRLSVWGPCYELAEVYLGKQNSNEVI